MSVMCLMEGEALSLSQTDCVALCVQAQVHSPVPVRFKCSRSIEKQCQRGGGHQKIIIII